MHETRRIRNRERGVYRAGGQSWTLPACVLEHHDAELIVGEEVGGADPGALKCGGQLATVQAQPEVLEACVPIRDR